MFALDKNTGNQLWKFPTVESVDGAFKTAPVMSDGTLVVGTDRSLYGIDPDTGKQKWYYPLPGQQDTIFGQLVSVGKSVAFGDGPDNLMAVNGADGKPTWKDPQHVYDQLKGNLAAFQNNLYFFTQTNNLCSMDVVSPERVKIIARFTSVSADATPVVNSDVLYANSGSYVVAVNAFSGTARWQKDTAEELVFGPAVSSEGVASVSRDGIVTIMDLFGNVKSIRDETKHTSLPMKIDLQAQPLAQPTAIGKFFVVPTMNGALNLIDPDSGQIVWQYAIHPMSAASAKKAPPLSPNERPDAYFYTVGAAGPVVASGDTMLVLAQDGSLLAFDKQTGVDMTGPKVKMRWPAEGAELNGKGLQLVFNIADEASGVNAKSIKITVDDKDMTYEYTADGNATVVFSDLNDNKTLDNGRHNIVVSAKDWMGNITTQHYTILIDNSLPLLNQPKLQQPTRAGKFGGGIGGGSAGGGDTGGGDNGGGGDSGGGDNGGGGGDTGGGGGAGDGGGGGDTGGGGGG